jgi:HEAT repeat protein
MGMDLLQFVGDDLDELRAAVARAMSQSQTGLALDVLNELARDPIWFVRLRAIVSLGRLSDRRAIPPLLQGLTDANRLVRLRAAEGLVGLQTEMVPIFEQVVGTQDRYGLHAYLTALDNANLRGKLDIELQASTRIDVDGKKRLENVLKEGSLPREEPARVESAPTKAEALP